jgi:N,N'-diacetyllegionaminate synthase
MNLRKEINKKGFFLIAEIGNNHGGNLATAKKMILAAHKAGADAVKLQHIIPEKLVHKSQKKRISQLKKICLSTDQILLLYSFAKRKKINLFSTIFDLSELKKFSNKQKYFKIASGDNNIEKLYKEISKIKKPTFISTGFLDYKSLPKIFSLIKKYWSNKFSKNNICIMHCISSYPTKDDDLNLRSIKKLDQNYIIGYSDHSIGIENCLYANILGAQVIEKHFTLNKKNKSFRDHELSADPRDLGRLKKKLVMINIKLGENKKKLSYSEKKHSFLSRRSAAYNKNLKKNHLLTEKDILYLRPERKKSDLKIRKLLNKKIKSKKTEYQYI